MVGYRTENTTRYLSIYILPIAHIHMSHRFHFVIHSWFIFSRWTTVCQVTPISHVQLFQTIPSSQFPSFSLIISDVQMKGQVINFVLLNTNNWLSVDGSRKSNVIVMPMFRRGGSSCIIPSQCQCTLFSHPNCQPVAPPTLAHLTCLIVNLDPTITNHRFLLQHLLSQSHRAKYSFNSFLQ